MLGLNVF